MPILSLNALDSSAVQSIYSITNLFRSKPKSKKEGEQRKDRTCKTTIFFFLTYKLEEATGLTAADWGGSASFSRRFGVRLPCGVSLFRRNHV